MIRKCNWRLAVFLLAVALTAGCKKPFVDALAEAPEKSAADEVGLMNTSGYLTESYPLPIRVDAGFKWGVNGHPMNQESYMTTLAVQIDLLKELNIGYYRVDIPNNDAGIITDQDQLTRLENLAIASAANNITLVPVIRIPDSLELYSFTPAQAEVQGYNLGHQFALDHHEKFTYYTLGNEQENDLFDSANPYGSSPSEYNTSRFNILAAFFKGMIAGIKDVDIAAKIVINNAGGRHWGYFTKLDQANVAYDILGYNTYNSLNEHDNVLNTLTTQFASKEVWFTEVNTTDRDTLNNAAAHLHHIEGYISRLDQRSNIKGFFIYELLDEDHLFDEEHPNGIEHRLGLIDWVVDKVYTNFTRKPAFTAYKFRVEETKHGFEDFIYTLYRFGNHRTPDPGGLAYWTGRITSNRNVSATIDEFLGIEFNQAFVREQYLALYGRAADPTGLDYWTGRLQTDLSREQLIATFCSDTEFWQLAGSTNAGWVNRAYQQLLGVAPTTGQSTTWLTRLGNGDSKYSLILELIATEAYLTKFVRSQFNFLLRRNGVIDTCSEEWGVGLLSGGMSQVNFIKTLLNGKEFWQRAIQEGYVRNNPPYLF